MNHRIIDNDSGAAAPGRPGQGPTLPEGRSTIPARGVLS
jgi:hypothetical protein